MRLAGSVAISLSFALGLLASGACGTKKEAPPKEEPVKVQIDAGPPVKPTKPLAPLAADPGATDGKPRWAVPIGGLGSDVARDVAVLPSGAVVVCGDTEGEATFGALGKKTTVGKSDSFVMAIDPDGKPLWLQTLGGPEEETCSAIAVAPDGTIAIGGLFSGDIRAGDSFAAKSNGSDDMYVAAFSPDGKPLWLWTTGGDASDAVLALAATADNGFLVGGGFYGAVEFGAAGKLQATYEDGVIVRLDGGDVTWARRYGGDRNDRIVRLAVDGQGSILVGAEFEMKSELGGPTLESAGAYDLAIAKLDPNGAHVWSQRFGGTDNDNILALAVDPAGNIAIAGAYDKRMTIGDKEVRSSGDSDALIARFDPDGKILWSKVFGGTGEDVANGVAVDAVGNVVVTGWFSDKVDLGKGPVKAHGNKDAFTEKLSPDGEVRWIQTFGDRDHDKGHAVAVDKDGNVYVAGIFRFTMTLPIGTFDQVRDPDDKAPKSDAFVMRLER
jgi:hypothetical protein